MKIVIDRTVTTVKINFRADLIVWEEIENEESSSILFACLLACLPVGVSSCWRVFLRRSPWKVSEKIIFLSLILSKKAAHCQTKKEMEAQNGQEVYGPGGDDDEMIVNVVDDQQDDRRRPFFSRSDILLPLILGLVVVHLIIGGIILYNTWCIQSLIIEGPIVGGATAVSQQAADASHANASGAVVVGMHVPNAVSQGVPIMKPPPSAVTETDTQTKACGRKKLLRDKLKGLLHDIAARDNNDDKTRACGDDNSDFTPPYLEDSNPLSSRSSSTSLSTTSWSSSSSDETRRQLVQQRQEWRRAAANKRQFLKKKW